MNIAVLTSGGDAPGMNAAIRAVVRGGIFNGHDVYVIYDGYQGLMDDKFKKADKKSVSEILSKGGTVIGTARAKDFFEKKGQLKAFENLKKRNIDYLVVIGGEGTFKGAQDLEKMGIKTIGIPATIDNDISGTDFTIGFYTALNTIVSDIDKLKDTSSSHQRASIVETMGRHKGDLALYAGLSTGAEFIITPENPMDKNKIIERLKQHKKEGRRNAIIVVTENILNVHEFALEVSQKSGFACRATVLGYVQRGGSPVPQDRMLASRMGAFAIDLIEQNKSGLAIGVRHEDIVSYPYKNAFIEDENQKHIKELYQLVPRIS